MFRETDARCFELARAAQRGEAQADSLQNADLKFRVESLVNSDLRDLQGIAEMVQVPQALGAYLSRKVAALSATFSLFPSPGQIVSVERLVGPKGPMEEDLARPLCAVIDSPTETEDVWWGWMVGAEPDYACEWDFVLYDSDEPRDPLAAVVQLWNPVRVYLPSVARVIGPRRQPDTGSPALRPVATEHPQCRARQRPDPRLLPTRH